jgi:hypothetical protein
MNLSAVSLRPPVTRTARPKAAGAADPTPPISPDDLKGLSASAYGSLARSFREKGRADLADRFTLEAVNAATAGLDALHYATQRYGPKADAPQSMNQYVRSDAPFVASPEVQAKAVALAAAKFKAFGEAEWALRENPAQTPEANTSMIKRMVDLAGDSDQVRDVMSLIKGLGSPEGVAYAEAAVKSKPKPSFWTRLLRGLQQL